MPLHDNFYPSPYFCLFLFSSEDIVNKQRREVVFFEPSWTSPVSAAQIESDVWEWNETNEKIDDNGAVVKSSLTPG